MASIAWISGSFDSTSSSFLAKSSPLMVTPACFDAQVANVHQLATGPVRAANAVDS